MKNKDRKFKSERKLQNKEGYISPNIKVIKIEVEQNLFAGSGDLPGLPGENW